MKASGTAAQNLLYRSDFPAEILSAIPVVEIKGQSEAVILNHRGILSYLDSEIRVASKLGPIRICGTGLMVHRMTRERIVLQGTVLRVELYGEA